MSLAILFHCLCTQHVSDINISIIRSLRLCCWITTLVVLFSARCVLEIWYGWASACSTDTTETHPHQIFNTHRTENNTTNVVIQQNSRKLLMMDILMSETCCAHKKWNKIASDIMLVFIFQRKFSCVVFGEKNAKRSSYFNYYNEQTLNYVNKLYITTVSLWNPHSYMFRHFRVIVMKFTINDSLSYSQCTPD